MERDASAGIPLAVQQFSQYPDEAQVGVKVASAVFGVSVPTTWRWVREGRLETTKLGPNTTRFRVGDIRRLIAAGRSPRAA